MQTASRHKVETWMTDQEYEVLKQLSDIQCLTESQVMIQSLRAYQLSLCPQPRLNKMKPSLVTLPDCPRCGEAAVVRGFCMKCGEDVPEKKEAQ